MTKPFAAVALLLAPLLSAQNSQPSMQTLEALLAEVRQLRQAIERSAILGPKLQLTAQRLSLQDQKIARLSSQLDMVRREIAARTEGQQRLAQQVASVEQRIVSETDPVRRKQLETEREHMKGIPMQQIDPSLLARETELSSTLRTEQAMAQELNAKLDAIERTLDLPAK